MDKLYSIKLTRTVNRTIIYLILTIGASITFFPLIWTLSTSFKTIDKVTMATLELIPNPFAWWNYVELFQRAPVLTYLQNTLVIVAAALFGSMLTCSLAGYAFARVPFPGRDALFMIVLSTMMLPYVVRLIPLFVMFDQVGLINTPWPLLIPRLLGHDAFYIFLFRQFFKGIPEELFDAARVDGCAEWRIWWSIVLPNSRPVLATVAIFSFQSVWNDFLYPLIYLGGDKTKWTLALGLNGLRGYEGDYVLNIMMAMSILMIIPVLLVFFFGQKYIVEGAAISGIKG